VRSSLASSLLICSLVCLYSAATRAETHPEAIHVVESLHAVLIDAMQKSEALSYQARFELIAPTVAEAIDQRFMAEKSIGRNWKKLTEAEQQLWLQTFARFTVANYAGRFKGYSGEVFQTHGEEDAPRDTKLVKTVLVLPDDDDVALNYRLRLTSSGWKIIDIYMNGTVSELSLRRSDYSSTLKRDGFEALVEALKSKIAALDDSKSQQFAAPVKLGGNANP